MMMRRTVVSALTTLLATASLTLSAYAQQSSTAFTFQGYLKDGDNPANGDYDIRFSLYTVETSGSPIGTVELLATPVEDGLFTVRLDFGINPFEAGQRRWIEIAVKKTNTSTYRVVRPRIEITAAPYALFSQMAQQAVNAQNAINAQNATNAQNAQNATNAQNAVNAQNAQNANTANSANALRGYPVSSTAPQPEQILRWVSGEWRPSNDWWRICSELSEPTLCPRLSLQLTSDVFGRIAPITGGTSLLLFGVKADNDDPYRSLAFQDWPYLWYGLATADICARNIKHSTLSSRSDMRLKQNIASLDPLRDSERLLSLRPVSYEWKPEAGTPGAHYGFIAQEVREIFPELVDVGVDPEGKETLGVRYLELIPHLVNVLQKQQAEINELRAEIQRLRGAVPTTDTQR